MVSIIIQFELLYKMWYNISTLTFRGGENSVSIFDCINMKHNAEKDQDILNVLNSTCNKCRQNPLMADEPICPMEHRKNGCIITYQALCKAGLRG